MAESIPITALVRSAPRVAEVASLLVRFGFGYLLREVGLEKLAIRAAPTSAEADSPASHRVRLLLEELGSTFIKLGQIASTRADLLPPDWIEEFKNLQGRVPPEPWEGEGDKDGIGDYLRKHLGDRLDTDFVDIEHEALAGASIAQVHRAKLNTGERVVLKIVRPGIREQLSSDIELMRLLSRLVSPHIESMGFDPEAVIDEFSRQLRRETDLLVEARSMARMRADFENTEGVTFPKVYRELSTSSVLVMEEVDGTPLSDIDISALSHEERTEIVRCAADAVFRQCLELGFFHADPHPGNIFVVRDEDGNPGVCFVDCGMTGLIEPGTLDQLAGITHGAINAELDRVVNVAIDLSQADPIMLDDRAFRAATWQFIDEFKEGSLQSIRMGRLLDDFFALLRRFKLSCPADVVYLIKALTTIEGVASSIAPDFDVVSYVHPYVERLVRKRYGWESVKARAQGALTDYIDLVETLPNELATLLKSFRRKSLSVQLHHEGLKDLTDEVERASMNISWSVGLASVIIGCSVLILADSVDRDTSVLTIIASAGFVLAIAGALFRFAQVWLQRRGLHKED